jgi:hypothetical protein
MCGSALAADLPMITKAPPVVTPIFASNHFYMGFNFGGAAGTVDAVTPTGAGKFTQANGQMGVTLGYGWKLANNAFVAIEGDFDALGQSGNALNGLSLNGPMAFDQRLVYGGGAFDTVMQTLQGIFNFGAVPGFPQPPVGQSAINTKMYGFVGIFEADRSANFGLAANKVWEIGPEVGMGIRTQYSSGMATDVSTFALLHDKSQCVGSIQGPACEKMNAEMGVRFRLLTAPGY